MILINALHVGFWIEQSGLNQPLVRILVFSLHVGTVHILNGHFHSNTTTLL